ncbi:amino acid ABC transporter permease [Sinorhizobium meliloti]|uniref:amino acid ABC transporter permease n=1 Tax=Rhizobium meliloti TaxID=382 RepID=UPI000FDA70AF|nr:amino acid ABC transporter permease [Sinorhizobium meliloti]RVP19064.1 amino acid ABC transporter permease [Sinorhizobium meliloti]
MDWLIGFYNYRIVAEYLPQFLSGLAMTLQVSATALAIALAFGTAIALARLSHRAWIARPVTGYVEAVRATPLLIQLYLLYFTVPPLPGVGRITALEAGILALGFNNAAYFGEIIRAGLQSVARPQVEAARALAFSSWQSFRFVVLPQAIQNVMAPLIGQTAMLLKDSSVVSFVGVIELTAAGAGLMNDRLLPNEGFLTVAMLYLAIYLIALKLSDMADGKPSKARTERQW